MPDLPNNQAQPHPVTDIIMNETIQRIATLDFGKQKPKRFMDAINNFLKSSPDADRERDLATVDTIYKALIDLQNAIFNDKPIAAAQNRLKDALYDPTRPRNLGGMQTADLFCREVTKVLSTLNSDLKNISRRTL